VGRLAFSQLRYRPVRLVTLLVGLVLATSAFTVLTAAAKTSQLRTVGTVTSHFVPAYDILVRPKGARTALEARTHTVQPNFLSGIYGGITMADYHRIESTPGVAVAAPIAMVGYSLLMTTTDFPVPKAAYDRRGRQLYRVNTTWVSESGASRIKQPPSYLYVTPARLKRKLNPSLVTYEVAPGGRLRPACPVRFSRPKNPFGLAAQSDAVCWSKVDGDPPYRSVAGGARVYVQWSLPVLIAAVDPVAEAKLDHLNRAVVRGSYLSSASSGLRTVSRHTTTFPVLASTGIGMDEYADTTLQALASPHSAPDMTLGWRARHAQAPGHPIATHRASAGQAYADLLSDLSRPGGLANGLTAYWNVGPVRYRQNGSAALVPQQVTNKTSVWHTPLTSNPPMDNADTQYRAIKAHSHASNKYSPDTDPLASPRLVGVFNPAKIPTFDQLADLPLGAYASTVARPDGATSSRLLGGNDLVPNQNLGGYVAQPANLITSLSALPALQVADRYSGNLHTHDPISVIRVRVHGVTGPNALSLARVREVAQQIQQRTHLDVDIVDGVSGMPTTIALPASRLGEPPLRVTEYWVKKGVGLRILHAVDRNSVALYVLILVVCALFVANSATAAVRSRRQELGILACLGWTRPRLFLSVVAELAAVGLVAGVVGAFGARLLAPTIGLHASTGRAVLAVPVAVGVAVLAGLVPAALAARADAIASVRPAVLSVRRAHHPRGVTALAATNAIRTPVRVVVAALSLAAGVVALTVLAAVSFAFHGVLVGTLLGNAIALQVRSVDYVAAIATIAVGVVGVTDVIVLNIRERAPELSAIRAFGWRERVLGRLVVTEGAIIGLIGSALGAGVGLYVAAHFAGQLPGRLYAVAAVEVVAGVIITAAAALLPAQVLRRLPASHLLAEE